MVRKDFWLASYSALTGWPQNLLPGLSVECHSWGSRKQGCSLSVVYSPLVQALLCPPGLACVRAKHKLNATIPRGAGGKKPACLCRRHKRLRFNLWFRKVPQRRAWQPTPVFLPGESHGQRSHRVTKSRTWLTWLSVHMAERIKVLASIMLMGFISWNFL